jgi:hypothetical protein
MYRSWKVGMTSSCHIPSFGLEFYVDKASVPFINSFSCLMLIRSFIKIMETEVAGDHLE